mmetsp:Transcript_28001/g.80938  ORF Transcript_28001/g.80938 Transcript_28001/m.80938 type:complete len:206 (-) Transcript_28001:296-913(-)
MTQCSVANPIALAVLLAGINLAWGLSSPGACVDCSSSRATRAPHSQPFGAQVLCVPSSSVANNVHRIPNGKPAYRFMANPTKTLARRSASALLLWPRDQGDVIGGEPPRKPSLAIRSFRAFKRGMGYIKNTRGTAAVVITSIVLLALFIHFGRMAWARAYVYLEWFFSEMYRQTTTAPWDYEKKYGHIPLGANPDTYGKFKGRGW